MRKMILGVVVAGVAVVAGRHCLKVMRGEAACPCARFLGEGRCPCGRFSKGREDAEPEKDPAEASV